MLMAAFGDIRGNLPALQAVMAALAEEGIQTLVNTGDCAGGHPWPNEVLATLRSRGVVSVQGERDRQLARYLRKSATLQRALSEDDYAELEKAYSQVNSETLEDLRSLPRTRQLRVDGISIALCHGGLATQTERLGPADPDAHFRRQREIAPVDIIVCGYGEEAFVRRVDGTLFVNPGSVGMAKDGLAHFALISTEADPYTAELKQIPYVLDQ